MKKLTRAFLTHLHSDHTAGCRGLILTPRVLHRDQPLEVYSSLGRRPMTEHILAAHRDDKGYVVKVHHVHQGPCFQEWNVRVEAFPVSHGSIRAFAFKLHTPDGTIAVSGDTAPTKAMAEASNGCGVLMHELYSVERFEKRWPVWQRYHSTVHTSFQELAEITSRAEPGLLIL